MTTNEPKFEESKQSGEDQVMADEEELVGELKDYFEMRKAQDNLLQSHKCDKVTPDLMAKIEKLTG